jgi:hypothetical protein
MMHLQILSRTSSGLQQLFSKFQRKRTPVEIEPTFRQTLGFCRKAGNHKGRSQFTFGTFFPMAEWSMPTNPPVSPAKTAQPD